jgi:thiol-disulfide isomerase/thioredoxin
MSERQGGAGGTAASGRGPICVIARSPAQRDDKAIQLDRAECASLGSHGALRDYKPNGSTTVASFPSVQANVFWMGLLAVFALLALTAGAGCARKSQLPWMTDFDMARTRAAQEGKYLLLDFTGSTWCPPCQALERTVFASPEFAAFSRSAVLVTLDFPPAEKRSPERIAADPVLAALMAKKLEYGVAAFPTVILLAPDQREIGRVLGYRGEKPAAFLSRLGASSATAGTQPPM